MTPLARAWLRKIALGLPLVAVPLASPLLVGLTSCGDCGNQIEDHSFPITEAQAARLIDGNGMIVLNECRAVCNELVGGIQDASVADGGAPDAGIGSFAQSTTASSCEVVSVGDMLEARCHWQLRNGCPGGRRPEGLSLAPPAETVGAWLARMAWMEAASVDAFEELAHALASFGAPSAIVDDARSAAHDERRHAALIGDLARARGATPPAPERAIAVAPRSLEALALDNAIEGGVRETFGALLASHQASFATELDVRVAMMEIARDEARHAMLSDRIDAWARTQVDGALLDQARASAARAFIGELETTLDEASSRALGLPSLEMQRALLHALA